MHHGERKPLGRGLVVVCGVGALGVPFSIIIDDDDDQMIDAYFISFNVLLPVRRDGKRALCMYELCIIIVEGGDYWWRVPPYIIPLTHGTTSIYGEMGRTSYDLLMYLI